MSYTDGGSLLIQRTKDTDTVKTYRITKTLALSVFAGLSLI